MVSANCCSHFWYSFLFRAFLLCSTRRSDDFVVILLEGGGFVPLLLLYVCCRMADDGLLIFTNMQLWHFLLMGKRELIALLNLSSWCLVMVERLFLAVPRGCLQFVIVVFPDHTHLLYLLFA